MEIGVSIAAEILFKSPRLSLSRPTLLHISLRIGLLDAETAAKGAATFPYSEMLKSTEALVSMNNKCTISSLYWHLSPLPRGIPWKFSTLSREPGKLLTGYITCLTTTAFPFLSRPGLLNSYGWRSRRY